MKMKASTGRKLRYGGISAVLTALIIAVVIIVNVIFSALTQKLLWYVDLTPELLFTPSEELLDLIENGDDEFDSLSPIEMVDKIREENKAANADFKDEDLMINIIFCDEPDALEASTYQRYVYTSALELEKEFPDYISVETRDIIRNPSSVSKFKTNSLSTIRTDSVIIEFGTEYRVRELRSFYTFNESTDETPWAYNGEKAFASAILAVTRAESPVACVVANHGENVTNTDFLQTLVDAGYLVQLIDLSQQEIPEKCRLLVVMDPKQDFLAAEPGITEVDEIEKLDKFLDGTNSLMIFMDPSTQRLTNLEDYLEEWGISYDRYTDESGSEVSHLVMDKSQSLTTDGYTFRANYATAGTGASLTKDMRSRPVAQSIIFKNAMSISYSDLYTPAHYTPEETDTEGVPFDYATYNKNGVSRAIYDIFTTSTKAEAYAGNTTSPIEVASDTNLIKLMTVSTENRTTQEDNYSTIKENSYVIACGSTEFASQALLQSSAYGNTDFLLTALRNIGSEPVPVGLTRKPFGDLEIDTVTTSEATQYTVVLALVPLLAAAITGVVIIVRRKNR